MRLVTTFLPEASLSFPFVMLNQAAEKYSQKLQSCSRRTAN